jgi:histidinol dehydrogenase
MRILDWNSLDRSERRAALARPELNSRAELNRVALGVIDEVRREGDKAVRGFTQMFDGVEFSTLCVSPEEFAAAREAVTPDQVTALERAIANVRHFHESQSPLPLTIETEAGVRCELITRPISRVGLYVPGGTAPLSSTVIMLAIPAQVAGCPLRILCTPPLKDGSAHPAVLVASELCGIDAVFKVGGLQAIAALAYGTESIPKVDKIFGPGNAWVTEAKQHVANDPEGAACDLPAGPSEVLVIADHTARADFVAADLLAQAEHDALSQAILVTNNRTLAKRVVSEIDSQSRQLSRTTILAESLKACRAIVVDDLHTAISVSNEYAPEHLILTVQEPRRWLEQIQNAGSVFLGAWSPETLGDYCSGTNHVLPTYGHARALSGLSIRDFVKTISVQEATPVGLRALASTAITLAELEGLDAHAQAVTCRLAAMAGTDR